MSQNSSITVDQPLARNNLQRRGNGNGGGRQMFPLPNPHPLSPPTARRTLVLQNQTDIVSVLSSVSQTTRQAMYILSGSGYVSIASLMSLPTRERQLYAGLGNILYLSGWFQPVMITNGGVAIPSSRPNGILHVSLTAGSQSVAIAISLISSGPIEVDVVFLCSPGSTIPSDAPGGGPREPIRVGVYVGLAAQAPAAPL